MSSSVDDELETRTVVTENRPAGIAVLKPEFIVPDNDCLLDCDEPKSNRRGQNKTRPKNRRSKAAVRMCRQFMLNGKCEFGDGKCRFSHDVALFMHDKPDDIAETCPIFELRGFCRAGAMCRFAKAHISSTFTNVTNVEKVECWAKDHPKYEMNELNRSTQVELRKQIYDFSRAERSQQSLVINLETPKAEGAVEEESCSPPDDPKKIKLDPLAASIDQSGEIALVSSGAVTDEDVIKTRLSEIRKFDWSGKLYLAPLTTVGNLPFRRICVEYGADVTCGEMALAQNIVQGTNGEWALLKRHESEKFYGVQVCGARVDQMAKTAQLISDQCEVDFVDVNLGCPIDMVIEHGAGCAMMNRKTRLEDILTVMRASLRDEIQLTVKMRTGFYRDKNIAHQLIPIYQRTGVKLFTLHGRSREQRYTKEANWEYVAECAELGKSSGLDCFGGGDVMSFEDYELHTRNASITGVMLARGALIKPWLFTEIKEQRTWDISASERLELLRKFANYGLDHWGSDEMGVGTTRRFLLELLSFLYRYIPAGIMERLPQRINDRPPCFVGRNDLETLMASNNCNDWIKLTEMLLGKVPEGFQFLPKHRANSYSYTVPAQSVPSGKLLE